MQEILNVSSQQELLYGLADHLVSMNASRFIPFKNAYVYPEPLKSNRPIYDGIINYVDDSGVIVNLNLPQEAFLYKLIADKHGVKGRHGTLQETVDAAWSRETAEYKNKVLISKWVKNGILIRKFADAYDVSRVTGASFDKVYSADFTLKRDGKLLETESESVKEVPDMELGPTIQTSIPTKKFKYFNIFSGEVPTDEELGNKTQESRGRFDSIHFDKNNLSSVRSRWYSDGGVLDADAVRRPLGRGSIGVLALWTDENPKK